jgi:hypothetical protein
LKDLNFKVESWIYADRGTGYPYETFTNVFPLNNQETVASLEHKKGEVWLVCSFSDYFWVYPEI